MSTNCATLVALRSGEAVTSKMTSARRVASCQTSAPGSACARNSSSSFRLSRLGLHRVAVHVERQIALQRKAQNHQVLHVPGESHGVGLVHPGAQVAHEQARSDPPPPAGAESGSATRHATQSGSRPYRPAAAARQCSRTSSRQGRSTSRRPSRAWAARWMNVPEASQAAGRFTSSVERADGPGTGALAPATTDAASASLRAGSHWRLQR